MKHDDEESFIIESFDPIVHSDSHILVLGTMPGQESLRQQQYYAHPRNLFWPMIYRIFGKEPEAEYTRRIQFLKEKKIALWDVFKSCRREGSLDSDIVHEQLNNVAGLVNQHSKIQYIFLNGGMADKYFKQRMLPAINRKIDHRQLPSTSPANASQTYFEKFDRWVQIRHTLEGRVLYCSQLQTELGNIIIYSDGLQITRVCLPGGDVLPPSNHVVFPEDALGEMAVEQIKEYFQGKRRVFDLPVKTEGTLFQEKVYKTLIDIPYGTTVSYGGLAKRAGYKNAARAVGQAVRKNPVPILIPCHRVVGSNGKNIGFMGIRNNPIQNKLIDLEQSVSGTGV